MMKVLHIITGISKDGGGVARSVQGLVASLGRAGVETWLATCRAGDEVWEPGINHFRTPKTSKLSGLRTFFDGLIQEVKPDIIHLHGIWLPQIHIAVKVARKHGIPYILTPRGMLEPWSLEQKKWKKRIAMWFYQRRDLNGAAALHATAESEAEQFRRLGFKNRIIVSANGVNLPQGLGIRDQGLGIRNADVGCVAANLNSQLSTLNSHKERTALFMSRMHVKKGVVELVEAWAKIRPQGWKCELVYTVSGDEEREYEAKVKRRIEELELQDDFVLTGALTGDDKWEAYRRADFFVLPTYSENFGIVVAEALYAGIPVITTKGAPWGELEGIRDQGLGIEDQGRGKKEEGRGRCGMWIDIGVEPLESAMRKMMTMTDAEREEMGKHGRELVEKKYLWDGIAIDMHKAYQEILANNTGAPINPMLH